MGDVTQLRDYFPGLLLVQLLTWSQRIAGHIFSLFNFGRYLQHQHAIHFMLEEVFGMGFQTVAFRSLIVSYPREISHRYFDEAAIEMCRNSNVTHTLVLPVIGQLCSPIQFHDHGTWFPLA